MPAPRVLVLLCTYNERHNLPDVLAGLWETLPTADVLVMDDNSPDGTGTWAQTLQAEESRLHVVVRSGKLGLGSALRAGLTWGVEHRYDYLVNLDADQSHDPRAVGRLLELCLADQTQRLVTIGSRYTPGGASTGLSTWRLWSSRIMNWYGTTLLRLPVRDSSSSYRCYPVTLLQQLKWSELTCNGYGFLEEILVRLVEVGARLEEVPITYHARGSGTSKLSLSDAWGVLSVIHRLALRKKRK
ncbi:MAG: glycosyltransferase [Pirellulaceae bacterium]|nr:glycosyltransferase [Pirellulaceae bacterium]